MKRLRRENEILRQEREIQKSYEHLHAAPSVKVAFIDAHRHCFPVIRLCSVLGISENGDDNWRKRALGHRKQEDKQRAKRIEDAFQENRGVYGSPRLHAELKDQGIDCGRTRVVRLMQAMLICASRKRRKAHKTDSDHHNPFAPNLLERDCTAQAPNRK